jgi:hypothetical protein
MKAAAGYCRQRCVLVNATKIDARKCTRDRLCELMEAFDKLGYDTCNVRDVMKDWDWVVFTFAIYCIDPTKYANDDEIMSDTCVLGNLDFADNPILEALELYNEDIKI